MYGNVKMPLHEIHYVSVAAETTETHHGSYATRGQSGEDYFGIEHAVPPREPLAQQAITNPP